MIKLINLTYDEFLELKKLKYSSMAIILLICAKLNVNVEDIIEYDFKYGLKIYVRLKDKTYSDFQINFINNIITNVENIADESIKNNSGSRIYFDKVLDLLDKEKKILIQNNNYMSRI